MLSRLPKNPASPGERLLGRTGMRVSSVCLGCMTFEPRGVDEKTAHKMLDRCAARPTRRLPSHGSWRNPPCAAPS